MERDRLGSCLQREAEKMAALESGLARAEADVNEERRRNEDLLSEIDRLRRECRDLEEKALAEANRAGDREREAGDLLREVDVLRIREADLMREVDAGRKGIDELKYMNEDQLKVIHGKENELDFMR